MFSINYFTLYIFIVNAIYFESYSEFSIFFARARSALSSFTPKSIREPTQLKTSTKKIKNARQHRKVRLDVFPKQTILPTKFPNVNLLRLSLLSELRSYQLLFHFPCQLRCRPGNGLLRTTWNLRLRLPYP